MFENYLSKMTKLTNLSINLESKEIGNEVVDEIGKGLGNLSNLVELELNLELFRNESNVIYGEGAD